MGLLNIRARSKASKRNFRVFDGKKFRLDSTHRLKSTATTFAEKQRSAFRAVRVFRLPSSQTVGLNRWAVYTRVRNVRIKARR